MKRLLLATFGTSLLLLSPACTPKREDKPPTPKVETTAAAALPPAADAAAVTLPTLGTAPKWTLKDLNGREVSSDSLEGKVVIVDFWATWCPPCRYEIPGYVDMQKKYGSEGLVIVGVSLDQAGPDVVKAFSEKFAINYPIAMGDEAVVEAFGGVEGLPTTFLIDRQGRIRDRKVGAEEHAAYEKKVLSVLRQS